MIIHIFQTEVIPQNRTNAVNTLKAMMGLTRAKSGCRKCILLSDVDNDDCLMLLEVWDSEEALDRHIQSAQYDLVLEAMELGIEEPCLEIHTVASSLGMAHVGSLRQGREL